MNELSKTDLEFIREYCHSHYAGSSDLDKDFYLLVLELLHEHRL